MGFFSDVIKVATLGGIDLDDDERKSTFTGVTPLQVLREQRRVGLEELQRTEDLRKQLEPFQLIAQGLTRDEQGNVVQATAEERASFQTPEARLAQQNLMSALQGQASLLRGELPQGLEQALQLQEQRALRQGLETTARRGGLGGTPEAQLRARLLESGLLTRANVLGQELSRFSGITGQQRALQGGLLQQRLQNLQGQLGAGAPLLAAAGQATAPVLQSIQIAEQERARKAQASAGQLQGIGQLAGTALGFAAGGPAGAGIGGILGGGLGGGSVGTNIPASTFQNAGIGLTGVTTPSLSFPTSGNFQFGIPQPRIGFS